MSDVNVERLSEVVEGLQKALSGASSETDNLSKAFTKALNSNADFKKEVDKLNSTMAELVNAQMKGEKGVEDLMKKFQSQAKIVSDIKKTYSNLAKETDAMSQKGISSFGKMRKGLTGLGQAVTYAHKTATQFNSAFGVQAITFSNALNEIKNYNKGLYELTRNQRILGKGAGDIKSALEGFTKNTTLSKVQALQFSNSIMALHVGLKPATSELEKFAASIQDSFGPDPETTIRMGEKLYAIQKQFPSLFNDIRKAHDQMKEGVESGNAEMLKSSTGLASGNIVLAMAMGMDDSQIETIMQYQDETKAGEKKILDLNEKNQKASQKAANANQAVGEAGEGAFKLMAKAMEKTYEWFGKNTTAAIGFALALNAIPAASSLMGAGKAVAKTLKGIKGARGAAQAAKAAKATKAATNVIPKGMLGASRAGATAAKAATNVVPKGMLGASRAGATAAKASKAAKVGRLGGARAALSGSSKLAKVAKVGGAVSLATDAVMFATTITKSSEEIDKAVKDFSKKSFGKQLAEGILNSGKTIALATRESINLFKAKSEEKKIKKATIEAGAKGFDENAKGGGFETILKKNMGEEKFAEASKKHGLDDAKEEDRLDILRAISKEHQNIIAPILKADQAAKTLFQSYKTIKADTEAILNIQNALTQSLQASVDVSSQFLHVNQQTLSEITQSSKEAEKLAKIKYEAVAKQQSGLAQGMLEEYGVKFDVNMSADEMLEKINKVMPQVIADAEKEMAKINAKEGDYADMSEAELNEARGSVTTKVAKVTGLKGNITTEKAKVEQAGAKNIQAQNQEILKGSQVETERLNILSQRIEMEKQMYENAHFGMGVSVELLQKQINLEKQKGDVAKKAQSEIAQETAKALSIDKEKVLSYAEGNISQEEAVKLAKEATNGKMSETQIQNQLGNALKEINKLEMDKMKSANKQLELTKKVREGYIGAMAEMMFGAGEFADIIGNQDKGVTQLMDTVEGAGGSLDTFLLGGQAGKEEGMAAGKGTAVMDFVAGKDGKGGIRTGRSKAEHIKGAAMVGIDMNDPEGSYEKALKEANMDDAGIGSVAGSSPNQVGALVEGEFAGDKSPKGKMERSKADAKERDRVFDEASIEERNRKAAEGENVKGSIEARRARGEMVAKSAGKAGAEGITDADVATQQKAMTVDNNIKDGASMSQSHKIGQVEVFVKFDSEGVPFVDRIEHLENALIC